MKLIGARQAWFDSQHESSTSSLALNIDAAKKDVAQGKTRTQRRQRRDSFFPATGDEESEKAGHFPVKGQRVNMRETRNSSNGRSTARTAHLMMMGKIQRAIATLPFQVQQFGHFMYSPVPNMRYVMNATLLICTKAELCELTPLKRARALYLVTAALQSFKCEAAGATEWGPARVEQEMKDFYGLVFDKNNWRRDWKPTWDLLKITINQVDIDAQCPIWQVINSEKI